MSDVKLPTLNRSSRGAESREKDARRKPWAPPSRLDAPPAPPGYKHRWIRAEAGGFDDRTNISGKLREGYELVRGDEQLQSAMRITAIERTTNCRRLITN